MKAIYKEQHNRQEQSFVYDDKADIPALDDHDVLIEVAACCLSQTKTSVITEFLKRIPGAPLAVAYDVAGLVKDVGSEVTSLKQGQRVTGTLPADSPCTGCAEFCTAGEHDVVVIPDGLDLLTAVASVGDGVRAYTALQYLAKVHPGDVLLIFDAASAAGSMALQLAQSWRAKVIATVSSGEERSYLEKLATPPDSIVELGSERNLLASSIAEETGGLGVDVIIDSAVQLFTNEDDVAVMGERWSHPVPTKHEIISCLGVGGRWVTSHPQLQLDPPNSQLLYLKGASVCFLCEQTWMLSAAHRGRYQHILKDLMKKLTADVVKPAPYKTVAFSEVLQLLNEDKDLQKGKTVVVMS